MTAGGRRSTHEWELLRRRLADADLVSYNDTQLNVSIDIFLDGMELRRHKPDVKHCL